MKTQLLTMRENLDKMLNNEAINSEVMLLCSQELDKVILEYYQEWVSTKIS
jgi:hypothetical protein